MKLLRDLILALAFVFWMGVVVAVGLLLLAAASARGEPELAWMALLWFVVASGLTALGVHEKCRG